MLLVNKAYRLHYYFRPYRSSFILSLIIIIVHIAIKSNLISTQEVYIFSKVDIIKCPIVLAMVQKSHKQKNRSRRSKVKLNIKNELFGMFKKNNFASSDAVDFLSYVGKDFNCESKELVGFREAVENQFDQLSVKDKRSLVSILTHKDGQLNEDVLQSLPFLRKRSARLLANPERKERSDKIDLQFVSDFMHDYCRYASYSIILIYYYVD